jgi:hypothetical protein
VKYRFATLFIGVASALSLFATFAVPASATQGSTVTWCTNDYTGYCIDLYQYNVADNADIVVWPRSTSDLAEGWYWYQVGTVCNGELSCGSGVGPFKFGSGMNAEFDGDRVVHIVLAADANWCMGMDSGYHYGRLHSCSTGTGRNWVMDGNSIVSLAASNYYSKPEYGCEDPYVIDKGTDVEIRPDWHVSCRWYRQ